MAARETIRKGSTGEDVRAWQHIVGAPVDGVFGLLTDAKTRVWQAAHELDPDGVVGPLTWETAGEIGDGIELIQARYYNQTSTPRTIRLVVIHTMETPERAGAARAVARWFASEQAPKASAHYCVDGTEIVRCVRDADVAWHAGRVNVYSIGIEHAGFAGQSPADWRDEYSIRMLARSAGLVAKLCERYQIPPRRLTNAELHKGLPGICGHLDVTRTWNNREWSGSGHTDPGEHFPWPAYLAGVERGMMSSETPP